ncbi:DNA polymerase III subunit epsilon [Alphaproteobacteria bacterium]|nr:DNA polymerase III subunit epsilon [Alphaproteobacteria bacterium]
MREIVLDTETTGLDVNNGDRIVEIGIVELENHVQTGACFHYYLNPERDSGVQALQVHGLTTEFLKDKPKFIDIADQFIDFVSDSKIIIHNAPFDVGFINAELRKCEKKELNENSIIDSLLLAKKHFLGQSVSLDSLCRKFDIDISDREIHGALKDAKLLAHVYLELIGGKQTKLEFNMESTTSDFNYEILHTNIKDLYKKKEKRDFKNTFLNITDNELHKKSIKEIPNSIWEKLKN